MPDKLSILKCASLTVLLFFAGCGKTPVSNVQTANNENVPTPGPAAPALPSAQKVEDGVLVHKVRLNPNDSASDVWIYLPEKTNGDKLPVVLVTAAGSYLWNGTSLGDGDQPEHLPYVRKGYAVIAYETPGDLDDVDLDEAENEALMLKAIVDFKNSKAGLVSEQNALDYGLAKIPSLDAQRIYVAGHSSAATHSLLVAASEPRVKAAIAYAPAVDLEKRLAQMIEPFNREVPGFKAFILESSPKNIIPRIKVPVFIFHANDDSVIPVEDTRNFAAELRKSNASVTFVTVNAGDHYDSMIEQGIPKGVEWLDKIAAISSPAAKKSK